MATVDFSNPTQAPLLQIYRQGTLRGRGGLDEDEFAETEGALSPLTSTSHSITGSGPSVSQYSLSIYSQPNASAVSFSQYDVAPHHEPQLDHDPFPLAPHDEAPPPYIEFEETNDNANVDVDEVVETPVAPPAFRSTHAPSIASGTTTTTDLYAAPTRAPPGPPTLAAGPSLLYPFITPPDPSVSPLSQHPASGSTSPPLATPLTKGQEAGYDSIPRFETPSRHDSSSSTDSTPSSWAPTIIVDSSDAPLFSRDPRKFFVYLVPYPKPKNGDIDTPNPPERFLLYTPMPSFLRKSSDGAKESAEHRRQRQFSEDRRLLKENKEKNTSGSTWHNLKAKTRLGFDDLSKRTTGTDVDFLARLPMPEKEIKGKEKEDPSVSAERQAAHSMEELVIVYPDSCESSKEDIRKTFISTMMKARSRAQRDAAIATALLPFAAAADFGAGSMGAMLALDSLWAYKSIRSARTAKALTDRFKTERTGGNHNDHVKFTMKASPALEPARKYMEERCFRIDRTTYPYPGTSVPSEAEVLSAIHWTPSAVSDGSISPQDMDWEIKEAHLDVEESMKKGAKEWTNWCKKFRKDPEKAFRLNAREKQRV